MSVAPFTNLPTHTKHEIQISDRKTMVFFQQKTTSTIFFSFSLWCFHACLDLLRNCTIRFYVFYAFEVCFQSQTSCGIALLFKFIEAYSELFSYERDSDSLSSLDGQNWERFYKVIFISLKREIYNLCYVNYLNLL